MNDIPTSQSLGELDEGTAFIIKDEKERRWLLISDKAFSSVLICLILFCFTLGVIAHYLLTLI